MSTLKFEKQTNPVPIVITAFILVVSVVGLLIDQAAMLEVKNSELKELLGSEIEARQRCEAGRNEP